MEIKVDGVTRTFTQTKILIVVMIPLAMSLMAVSSVNVALPSIESGLGASPAQLQWVLAGYALTYGMFLVPFGRLGDIFGRGGFFVGGLAAFSFFSLLCGFATTATMLNVFRFIQGISAAIMGPQIVGLIQQYFQGRERAKAFSTFGLVIAAAVAVGPPVTGAIIEIFGSEAGWRGSFWINFPLGVGGVISALFWLPFETERKAIRNLKAKVKNPIGKIDLDPVGMILLALQVVTVMFPFMYHGENNLVWGLLGISAVLAVLWFLWERHYEQIGRAPMVTLSLLGIPSFKYATLTSGIMFLGITSQYAVIAIFLQSGMGFSPFIAGFIGLPSALFSALGAWLSGKYNYGRELPVMIAALSSAVIGLILSNLAIYAHAHWGTSVWVLSGTLCLTALGMGAFGAANQSASMHDVPVSNGGTAGAFKQTVERVATAIGTAVVTGVFFAVVGNPAQATESTWTTAFSWAFFVIVICVIISLLLAVYGLIRIRHHARAAASGAAGSAAAGFDAATSGDVDGGAAGDGETSVD